MGEYFLASAFEKVILQKSGYVGMTGMGTQKPFFKGFFDKYGLKAEVFAREVRPAERPVFTAPSCPAPASRDCRHPSVSFGQVSPYLLPRTRFVLALVYLGQRDIRSRSTLSAIEPPSSREPAAVV